MAKIYDLEALLGLPLDVFVRSSYRLILEREADAPGFEQALTYLKKSGRRVLYLYQMTRSAEAASAVSGPRYPHALVEEIAAAFAAVRTPVLGARKERVRIRAAVQAAMKPSSDLDPVGVYFAFQDDRAYGLEAFYGLHGRKFVRAAFAAICDRMPSAGEETETTSALRRGESKAVVLSRLLKSHEGRDRGTRISGASALATVDTVVELPLIGHLLMLLVLSINLNKAPRYVRTMESEIRAAFETEEL